MGGDQSGWLFAAIDIAGALALLAALIFGVSMWRNRYRDPVTEQMAREATERLYHHEDAVAEVEAEAKADPNHVRRPTVDTTAGPT